MGSVFCPEVGAPGRVALMVGACLWGPRRTGRDGGVWSRAEGRWHALAPCLTLWACFLSLEPCSSTAKSEKRCCVQGHISRLKLIVDKFTFSLEALWISREGDGTPLQYSCLENPMDGGAWWAAVHGVTRSRRRLSDFTFTLHFHALEKEMATHSSVLAWRIPGTGEPGGLLSMRSHRVRHDWSNLAAAAAASSCW